MAETNGKNGRIGTIKLIVGLVVVFMAVVTGIFTMVFNPLSKADANEVVVRSEEVSSLRKEIVAVRKEQRSDYKELLAVSTKNEISLAAIKQKLGI